MEKHDDTSAVILIRLDSIEENQKANRETLNKISETLSGMAVQSERIVNICKEQAMQWNKIDKLESLVGRLSTFQASCPRESVHWAWCAIGATLTLLGGSFLSHVLGGK